jgi:hypothetical protein
MTLSDPPEYERLFPGQQLQLATESDNASI